MTPQNVSSYRLHRSSDYALAALWLLALNFISSSNDSLTFYLGQDLAPVQVAFIRAVVTVLSVLPFMLPRGLFYFRSRSLKMHTWRAVLGAAALGLNACAVVRVPLLKNTCISFTEPLLVLALAALFLREKIDAARLGCTLLGLLGILIVTYSDFATFNAWIIFPILSTLMYALITLIARKLSDEDPILTLLFYFGMGTSLLLFVPALATWQPVSLKQWGLLTVLGINGNLVQVCMLKAFCTSDVSALMPLRYTELIFTFLFGYFLFHQVPVPATWIGSFIIVMSAMLITILERRKERIRIKLIEYPANTVSPTEPLRVRKQKP